MEQEALGPFVALLVELITNCHMASSFMPNGHVADVKCLVFSKVKVTLYSAASLLRSTISYILKV